MVAEINQPIWFSVINWLRGTLFQNGTLIEQNSINSNDVLSRIAVNKYFNPTIRFFVKMPPDLQADCGDLLTGSQQQRHTHRGTCAHTTP